MNCLNHCPSRNCFSYRSSSKLKSLDRQLLLKSWIKIETRLQCPAMLVYIHIQGETHEVLQSDSSHEHVNATRRCTTPLCSVFKTSDEWDFWRKVNRKSRPCSLATSFTRSNITRLLFMGFCQRTGDGGSTYHVWRHIRKNTPSMYRNYTTNVGWS